MFLRFQETQLADALEVIERTYDVDLRWDARAITNCTITGNWSSEKFTDILLLLDELTGMKAELIGEKAYQLSGTCK